MHDDLTAGERRQQIEAILDEELEPASGQGADYLDLACALDPGLKDELVHMLDESAATFEAETLAFTGEGASTRLEGQTVGPYELLRCIGVGGMGAVYEAEDTRLRRRVALKFLPLAYARVPAVKERFLREARAISALDHSGIGAIHDIGKSDDGRLFLVMPYYPGKTLAQRLEQGPLPIEDARQIAVQVARGLRHAHQAGIVHRDIKPGNVILTES